MITPGHRPDWTALDVSLFDGRKAARRRAAGLQRWLAL